jgi:hypothetical protein
VSNPPPAVVAEVEAFLARHDTSPIQLSAISTATNASTISTLTRRSLTCPRSLFAT